MGLLDLFKGKPKSYLGVDIGTSGIKVVELADERGRASLLTYGVADVATDLIQQPTAAGQRQVAETLRALLVQAKVHSRVGLAALPSFAVFQSIVSLPILPAKELAAAVALEAKKSLPLPLAEVMLDWRRVEVSRATEQVSARITGNGVMPVSPRGSAIQHILISAAPKALVARYSEVFKQAGLQFRSMETESFALARALLGQDRATTMLVDIGALSSDIVLIENAVPVMSRSVAVGGRSITASLAESLRLPLPQAEQFKRDLGANPSVGDGLPKLLEGALAPLLNEIRYLFDQYQEQGGFVIEKLVLAGGSAQLPALSEFLAQYFRLPVFLGDPWARVLYPEDLKLSLREIGASMAVAVGLAMREIGR